MLLSAIIEKSWLWFWKEINNMKFIKYKDIYFCEENIENVRIIKHFSTKLDGFFKESQLKSLDSIKEQFYLLSKEYNGNVVMNFKYGQKSNNWFLSMFSLDDIYWYGEGDLIKLDKIE